MHEVAAPESRGLAALRERIEGLSREVGKFGIVGVIAWVVDTAVFNAFLSLQGNRYWAAVGSTAVSATVAFIGNRFWTWRDRPRSGLKREYVLYAIFNVVGLFISLACLGLSHEVLGSMWPQVFHTRLADNVAKQGVGLLLGTIFRFWSYRRFIFPKNAPEPDTAEATTSHAGTASAHLRNTGPNRPEHGGRPSSRHDATRPAHQVHGGSPVTDRAPAGFDD
ncbi:MAG TPA: GtrA family protein [Micromonosporaceae bacterium]|nr:GtrA family protein [Micromonosporaceae bacterium]